MEEVVELINLEVLGGDEVGLTINIFPTDDDNVPTP